VEGVGVVEEESIFAGWMREDGAGSVEPFYKKWCVGLKLVWANVRRSTTRNATNGHKRVTGAH